MSAIKTTSEVLDEALRRAGLEEAFDHRGIAYENCPGCGAQGGLKLSLARGDAQCSACGRGGPLLVYLEEKSHASEWNTEPFSDAEIIPIEPRLPKPIEPRLVPVPVSPTVHAELIDETVAEPMDAAAPPRRDGRWGERLIMSLLAGIFLVAGLAAAGLSGFANFQAFSLGVSDPVQARVWGWSGVIASVCSFGGSTLYWWHMSGKRVGEALRALVFAFAGAGTSIAGTSLFMMNNADGQLVTWQTAEELRALTEADIADWTRQLDGIPADTRSIEGLEAYLAGVEAAGRTHQKPYRDAQNELGLAKRRAALETKIAEARGTLRQAVTIDRAKRPAHSLPAWFFAIMLELFSSQATSIAFVSLLLLYGRQEEPEAVLDAEELIVV